MIKTGNQKQGGGGYSAFCIIISQKQKRGKAKMQFNEKATQAEIGRAIGISERSVRKFLKKHNINHKEYTLGELILKYIDALRKTAAGRDFGDVDLTREKGLLLKAKRKLAERKLEEEEKEEEFLGFVKDEIDDKRVEMCEFISSASKEMLAFVMLSTTDISKGKPESEAGKKLLDGILKLDDRLSQFIESCTDNKEGGGVSGGARKAIKRCEDLQKIKQSKIKKLKTKERKLP